MQPFCRWEGRQLPGRIQTPGKLPEPTERVQRAGDPVTFWCLQLGVYNVSYRCTQNPAQPACIRPVQMCSHTGMTFKKVKMHQCNVSPPLLLYYSLLKLILLLSLLLPQVSFLPANSLKPLVWKVALPAHDREASRTAISICRAQPRRGHLMLCSACAGGFWAVVSEETWY